MRPSVFEMAKLRMFSEMTAGHACRINALKCCFSNSIQFTTALLLLPSIYNAFQNIDSRQTTSTVLKKNMSPSFWAFRFLDQCADVGKHIQGKKCFRSDVIPYKLN